MINAYQMKQGQLFFYPHRYAALNWLPLCISKLRKVSFFRKPVWIANKGIFFMFRMCKVFNMNIISMSLVIKSWDGGASNESLVRKIAE